MKTQSESAVLESLAVGPAAVPRRDSWDVLLILAIFAGIGALAYAALATPLLQPLVDVARREHWSTLWVRPTIIWISMGVLLLLMRTVLWLAYRPFDAVREEDAPPMTVLIPAYNEGAMVEETIASVAAARYPRERLQIIAIDDGSTDEDRKSVV